MAGNEQNEYANMNYRQAKQAQDTLMGYQNYLMNTNATMQELMKREKGLKLDGLDQYGEQMAQMNQNYKSAREQLAMRMRALGMQSIDSALIDGTISLERVESDNHFYGVMEKHYQAESESRKKKRQQEENARNRAGDAAVANMIQCAGQNASLVGKAYEEKKKNGIRYQPMDNWSEVFTLSPHVQTDPAGQADMIANLMRFRDAHAERLKHAPQNTIKDKAYYRYNTEFVEYANDAIKTWQAAGGYGENGKRISAMARKRAQKHLPLAIEKYKYHMANPRDILGKYQNELLRETEDFKDCYAITKEGELLDTKQNIGLDMPLPGFLRDDMLEIRIVISENGEAYRRQKAVIDGLYEELLQCCNALGNIAIQGSAYNTVYTRYSNRGELDLSSERVATAEASRTLQMELLKDRITAAIAYIDYLLLGKTPGPEQAMCIEQCWHVSIGTLSLDRVPSEKLNLEQRLRDRMNGIENDATMPREYREKANQVYDRFRGSLDTVMGGLNVLEKTTRVALDRVSISNQMKIGQGFDQSAGYRDVVRLAVPFEAEEIALNKKTAVQEGEAATQESEAVTQENEMVTMEGKKATMDFDEIMKLKKALYRVDTGMQYVENRSASGELKKPLKGADCSAAELEADARKVLEVVIEAKKDMDAFQAAHQKAFEPLNVDEAFEHAETLNLFGKKMQTIRDTCGLLAKSKAFIGFDEELQKQIKELWDYGAAWMDYVQDRTEFCNLAGYKNLRGLMEEGTNVNVDKLKTTYEEWYERRKQEHTNLLNEKRALYTRNSGPSNPDAAAS